MTGRDGMSDEEAKNTDREIWRKVPDDYYSPSIHVTKNDGIGINSGGHVIVMPAEEWHSLSERLAESQAALGEIVKVNNDEDLTFRESFDKIDVIARTAWKGGSNDRRKTV